MPYLILAMGKFFGNIIMAEHIPVFEKLGIAQEALKNGVKRIHFSAHICQILPSANALVEPWFQLEKISALVQKNGALLQNANNKRAPSEKLLEEKGKIRYH
jgi:hypothetical protein